MAVGDKIDIYNRFIQNLPLGWFSTISPTETPNLWSLLAAFVYTFNFQYNEQYIYAFNQLRIQTSTGYNLDLESKDYLGNNLPRYLNENDDTYRKRILANLARDKATRPAMYNALLLLTGFPPIIWEGWNGNDSMYLGDGTADPLTDNPIFTGGLSYIDDDGIQHIYGNEALGNMSPGIGFPYQFSIVVFLPSNQGLADFPGLSMGTMDVPVTPGNPYFGLNYNYYLGNQSLVTEVITEQMIRQCIEFTKTLGTNLYRLTIIYVNAA